MSEPDVDPEKLEEARLTKTLSGARMRGHNAFTATQAGAPKKKISSPEKHDAASASPPQYGRAPMTSKPAASGPMPEWKRQQMDRDEAAMRKRDEEERRRQQYVTQITTGVAAGQSTVETTSAVTTNFVDPLAVKTAPRAAEPEPAQQPTAAQTFFDPADKEEELKREEDYLARRTGLSPQRTTSKTHVSTKVGTSGVAEKDAHLALGSKTQKLGVVLVDAASGATLEEGAFMLKNGRLPVLAVENGFKVRDLVWKENGQAIKAEADGYSAVSFGQRDFIEVTGHRVISG